MRERYLEAFLKRPVGERPDFNSTVTYSTKKSKRAAAHSLVCVLLIALPEEVVLN